MMGHQQLKCPEYEIKIQVKNLGKICKYHKLAYQDFNEEKSTTGLCPILHNLIYPFALSMLYEGPPSSVLQCPINPKINVVINKRKKWGILKYWVFYLILKITKVLGVPWDCELYDYYYRINGHDSCRYHQGPDEKKFNADDISLLCPASFYTIFPAIVVGEKAAHCVDHEGITYSLGAKND